jgi:uncharacterized protein (DUF169 family)
MAPIHRDLSIFRKFNFERPPVGVKFMLKKPEGIERIKKQIALCEMLKEAQTSGAFYATKDDFECVGPFILGMASPDDLFESGQMGPRLGVFEEARANARLYKYVPMMPRGTVRYAVFAPLDKLTFNPDVLTITATPSQAEVILRAMSYTTGKLWESKLTPVMGCAWMFVYPHLNGELNYFVTNIVHGMRGRHVLPDGVVVISIPWDLIPMITENLQHTEWVLPEFTRDRDTNAREFVKEIGEIIKEFTE